MMTRTAQESVLILGGTGGIGGEVLRGLRDSGWQVRAMSRRLAEPTIKKDRVLWLRGDALNPEDVRRAAAGCSVIVHAVNPPAYRRWADWVLPMLDNTIAAACLNGATIVLPGTVYNFGPDAFPRLHEDSPQHPDTRKGLIRVEMERHLRAAAEQGARALIVRAGDFFGPEMGNSWFAQGLVKPGRPVRKISNPGRLGIGHQWSYLPDVARTMIDLLAKREALAPFACFHMDGHWDADGLQMARVIQRVVVRRSGVTPKIQPFPWWALTAASPWVATFREIREMRYLWQQPLRMDNARLLSVLGQEPHTPLETAVEAALVGAGCLQRQGREEDMSHAH